MTSRRVVITGLGMLTPLGADVASTWEGIKAGKSGIRNIEHFDTESFSTRFAGLVPEFDIADYLSPKDARKMDVFIQYGLVAAIQAIRDAGLDMDKEDGDRVGAAFGSGIGGLTNIEDNHRKLLDSGPRKLSPFFVPGTIINMIAGNLAIMYGMKGPNFATVTACTTGTHNIGFAAQQIMLGQADVMVAGGAEGAICRLGIAGFASAKALSNSYHDAPETASRPYDKGRDGFVMGEGAGVVVLEEYEHAKKRGAKIYAEVLGYGLSGDAHHITAPASDGDGGYRAMQMALKKSGLSVDDIGYVNAHGTSTMADFIEVGAVERLFGAQAKNVAMSSTKSAIGHLLGAAGGVEAIFSILAMNEGILPPTINLQEPSESCELNLVPNKAQEKKVDAVLSNSFGFGGTNASLVMKRV